MWQRRVQAPLVLGGGVLAIDALVQLAPYLAPAYDAVPRWVTIGRSGCSLLVAGATTSSASATCGGSGRHVAGLG